MKTTLTLTHEQREILLKHLFPNDGNEAVAIALCGRLTGEDEHRLIVHKIEPIPYEYCSIRAPDRVAWSTEILIPLLEEAIKHQWGIVKIHGHPEHYPFHSEVDDESDRNLFPSIYGWLDDNHPHVSALLLPSGRIVGRVVNVDGSFGNLETVKVVGDDLSFYHATQEKNITPEFAKRTEQAFGKGTFNLLKTLKVGVIGCSGTGSPVIEQLARLGVGKLVLVDPDCIEEKNLNRILNSTIEDVHQQTLKVELMKRTIENIGLSTSVETYAQNLFEPRVVKAIAACDIVFGCMDSVDGRHLLNRLATFYSIPYIDIGIRLVADGSGGIDQICGGVHYLQPAQSLLERGVYTQKDLEAANLRRVDPESYKDRLKVGYISGVVEDRPAVISVNMFFASLAVMEMLGRLHIYRNDPNSKYSIWQASLSDGFLEHSSDDSNSLTLANHLGKGDVQPLLGMPSLSERR
jgi:hypothetical protein